MHSDHCCLMFLLVSFKYSDFRCAFRLKTCRILIEEVSEHQQAVAIIWACSHSKYWACNTYLLAGKRGELAELSALCSPGSACLEVVGGTSLCRMGYLGHSGFIWMEGRLYKVWVLFHKMVDLRWLVFSYQMDCPHPGTFFLYG